MFDENKDEEAVDAEQVDQPASEDAENNTRPDSDVSLEDIEVAPVKERSPETVPLSKYMEEKRARKELERKLADSETGTLTNQDLSALSDKYNVDENFIADVLAEAETRISKKVEAKLAPVLAQRQQEESDKRFDDAWSSFSKQYGDQIDKRVFKAMAQDPANRHLGTFEGIRKEFFANVKPLAVINKPSVDSPEGGSKPSAKLSSVDFANMTEEQHEKVLSDPKLRAEYYAYRDSIDGL